EFRQRTRAASVQVAWRRFADRRVAASVESSGRLRSADAGYVAGALHAWRAVFRGVSGLRVRRGVVRGARADVVRGATYAAPGVVPEHRSMGLIGRLWGRRKANDPAVDRSEPASLGTAPDLALCNR